MDASQQLRFWEAVITLLVTLNTVLIALLSVYQTRHRRRMSVRTEELARHIQQCRADHIASPPMSQRGGVR